MISHGLKSSHWYEGLDAGIRFAVKVLHAWGLETGQSCQGGEGHAYEYPTVDLWDGDGASGFQAAHALGSYGLTVQSVARFWRIEDGVPTEHFWRICLSRSVPERADEWPMFVRLAASLMRPPEEAELAAVCGPEGQWYR